MKRRLAAGFIALAMAAVIPNASNAAPDPIGELLSQITAAGQAALKAPAWLMKATYYYVGGGASLHARDSMGCRVVPMRTLAVDPHVVPKGSVVFIKETVGLPLPGGGIHDGLWYASDIGGAIKGDRIDLFTGDGAASARALIRHGIDLAHLTVTRVSSFDGCPPAS
ncbi:MAG TPA: 3D domain-containing protein [Caulobacteraceae bacterium]